MHQLESRRQPKDIETFHLIACSSSRLAAGAAGSVWSFILASFLAFSHSAAGGSKALLLVSPSEQQDAAYSSNYYHQARSTLVLFQFTTASDRSSRSVLRWCLFRGGSIGLGLRRESKDN